MFTTFSLLHNGVIDKKAMENGSLKFNKAAIENRQNVDYSKMNG
jgi:hypothetical protein